MTCKGTTASGARCKRRARADGYCTDAHAEGAAAPGGQKGKLTPEVVERICRAIRAGAHYETACGHAGIDESTFYRWRRDGQRPDAPAQLRQFCEAVKKAEHDAEVFLAGVVQAASRPTVLHSPYCEMYRQQHGSRGCELLDSITREPIDVGCKAVPGSWQAAMTLLERRHPERWRRRTTHEHVGGQADGDQPVRISHELITDERIRDQLGALKRGLADSRAERPERPGSSG